MAIKFFACFFPTISTFGCFWSQWPTSLAVTNDAVRAVAVAKRREYIHLNQTLFFIHHHQKKVAIDPSKSSRRLWCREATLQRQHGAGQRSIERIANGFPIVAQGRHEPGTHSLGMGKLGTQNWTQKRKLPRLYQDQDKLRYSKSLENG